MPVSSKELIGMIVAMGNAIAAHKDYLTELDSAIGDADHGINMERGFAAVLKTLPKLEGECCGTILKSVGMSLLSTVGGASGPLYGTAFMYAGNELMGLMEIGREDAAKAIGAAIAGVMKRGAAQVGDKTMVDTLWPVSKYMSSADFKCAPIMDALSGILKAAEDGMNSTTPMVAKRGRASFLKERSADHMDPGAVSSYLLISAALHSMGVA